MKKITGILGMAAGAVMLMSAPAIALDSSFDAMSKSGKHQFYVWCTGAADSVKTADGSDAKDAQAKLATASCWPVWQGLAG